MEVISSLRWYAMRAIKKFPDEYPLVCRSVEELRLYYPLSEEDEDSNAVVSYELMKDGFYVDFRHYDFSVTLKDGRSFVFTACTPEYVRDFMEREGSKSFVDAGLILVDSVNLGAMLAGLEQCLEKEYLYGLEHFGIRANSVDYNDPE